MSEKETVTEKIFEGKISIREFLVDFFGALMPGVVFLVLIIPAVIIPLTFLIQSLCFGMTGQRRHIVSDLYLNALNISDKGHGILLIGLFLLSLLLGYILGTVFYRRDLREPDYYSFLTIVKTFNADHLANWVIQAKNTKGGGDPIYVIENPNEINKKTIDRNQVQFPYNNLKKYLIARKREDLAKLVNWDADPSDVPNSRNSTQGRSKTFINGMKIELQFFCPEYCSTIIKNEAHVRLSSSMWYVSNYIRKAAIVGFCVCLISQAIVFLSSYPRCLFCQYSESFLIASVLSSAAAFFSYRMQLNIQGFFHYQRVREIFYVLETYKSADRLLSNRNRAPRLINKPPAILRIIKEIFG